VKFGEQKETRRVGRTDREKMSRQNRAAQEENKRDNTSTMTLQDTVASRSWYHTIELPGGIVTPGRWDTRGSLARLPFPASLVGKRTLDVGTWDGFWAFEMERRGAQEVVAIDIPDATQWDWPEPPPVFDTVRPRNDQTFLIAHRALNSRVQHRDLSVYDLHPDSVGFFDFAFIGTLLIHLRDPVRALASVKRVLRGQLLVTDQISLTLTLLRPGRPAADLAGVTGVPFWWTPNMAGLRRMMQAAGYQILSTGGPYFLKPGRGPVQRSWWVRCLGLPHAWVLGKGGP
jgi:tRNA (mo5U34)-methyltransferase